MKNLHGLIPRSGWNILPRNDFTLQWLCQGFLKVAETKDKKDLSRVIFCCETKHTQRKVKMESITTKGVVFDVGSLYAYFQTLKDSRKLKGLRYQLVDILVMMVIVKICGEDTPSGIADWVKHRSSQFKS